MGLSRRSAILLGIATVLPLLYRTMRVCTVIAVPLRILATPLAASAGPAPRGSKPIRRAC